MDQIKTDLIIYFHELTKLSNILCKIISFRLKVNNNELTNKFINHSSFQRINYCPVCKDTSNNFGISPHKDAGWLTILLIDEIESLQI